MQRKSAVRGLNSEKGVLSSHMLLSQTLPPRWLGSFAFLIDTLYPTQKKNRKRRKKNRRKRKKNRRRKMNLKRRKKSLKRRKKNLRKRKNLMMSLKKTNRKIKMKI